MKYNYTVGHLKTPMVWHQITHFALRLRSLVTAKIRDNLPKLLHCRFEIVNNFLHELIEPGPNGTTLRPTYKTPHTSESWYPESACRPMFFQTLDSGFRRNDDVIKVPPLR